MNFPFDSAVIETQNRLSENQDDGTIGLSHIARKKQGSEESLEQIKMFADTSHLHTSPNISS